MSWANTIQATTPFESEEIGINPIVAEGWGLKDGMSVTCSVIQTSSPLTSVSITLSEEDYQIAECSTDRIQNTLLEQVAVVGRYQSIVMWLSTSIAVKAVIGKTKRFFLTSRIFSFFYN